MTKLQLLHRALNERLMAAVEQIMEMVGGTVLEYEEETVRARKENEILRRRLRWMEGENPTDWPDPAAFPDPGETSLTDTLALQSLIIKTEPLDSSDFQLYGPGTSLTASVCTAGLEMVYPSTSAPTDAGIPDDMLWDSAQTYMAPLDFDPTQSTMARNRSQRRSFACPDCGKVFGREQRLIFHMRVHSAERPYTYRRRKTCFYGDKKRKKKLRGLTKTSREFIDDLSDASEQTEKSTGSANIGIARAGPTAPEIEPSEASDEASEHTSSSKLSETSAARPLGLKAKQGKEKAKTARCLQCNRAFTNVSRLAVHMKTHRKHLPSQDEQNAQGDSDRTDSGSQHLPKIPCSSEGEITMVDYGENEVTTCYPCRNNPTLIIKVIRNNETEVEKAKAIGQRLFQCPECKKIFARSCWLTFHLKSHERERKRQKKKQIPNNSLKNVPQVPEEQKTEVAPESSKVHVLKKIFACPYCDKVFAREGWLGPHIRSHTIKKQKSDVLSDAILPESAKRRSRRVIIEPSAESGNEQKKTTEQSIGEDEHSEIIEEQPKTDTSASQNITVELLTNPETQTKISKNSEEVQNEAESVGAETIAIPNNIPEESSPVPEESTDQKGGVKKSKKRFPCRECGKVYLLAGWLKTHKKMHKKQRLQEETRRQLMMMKEFEQNDSKKEGPSLVEPNAVKKKEKKKKKTLGLQETSDDKKKKKNQLTNAVLLKAMSNSSDVQTAADKSKDSAARGQCVCKDCGKVYARKNWLSLHMLGHRKALMALPQKPNDEALKSDMQTTQGGSSTEDSKAQKGKDGGKASFPCPFCDKVFPRAMRLMVHMQIHSGEKPYSYRQRKEQFYSDPTRPRVADTDKPEPAVESYDEKGKDGGIEVTSAVSQDRASTTEPMETAQPQSLCSGRKISLLPLQSSGAAAIHSTTLTRTDSKSDSSFSLQPRIVLDPVKAESSFDGSDFRPIIVETGDIELHQMPDSETICAATSGRAKSQLPQSSHDNSNSLASQNTFVETDDVSVKVGLAHKNHEMTSFSEKLLISVGDQQTSESPEHRNSEVYKRKGHVESHELALVNVHKVRCDPEHLEIDEESQQSESQSHTHGTARFFGIVKAKNLPPHSEYLKCGIDRACISEGLALTTVPEHILAESSSNATHQASYTESDYMILSDVSDDDDDYAEWANVSKSPVKEKKTGTLPPEEVADAGSIPSSSHKASDSDSDVTFMLEKTDGQHVLVGTLDNKDDTAASSVQQTEEPSSTGQKSWFPCTACGVTFAGEALLTQHMKVHSVSAGTYQKSNSFKTLKKRVKNNETKIKQEVQTSEVGSADSTDNSEISGNSESTLINVNTTKLAGRCPDAGATSRSSRADSKTVTDRKTKKGKGTLRCCYCGKACEKIELHLMHDHPEEPKVIEALHFSHTLEERKRSLSRLCSNKQLKHDYTTTNRSKNDGDLVHCIFCQGYYQRNQFWKHALICKQKQPNEVIPSEPGSSTDLRNTSLQSRTSKGTVQLAVPELVNLPFPKAEHHTKHNLYSVSSILQTGSNEMNPITDHGSESLSTLYTGNSSATMNLDPESSRPIVPDFVHSALECTTTPAQDSCSSMVQESPVKNKKLTSSPLTTKGISEPEYQSTLEPEYSNSTLQPHVPVLGTSYLLGTGIYSAQQSTGPDCQSSFTQMIDVTCPESGSSIHTGSNDSMIANPETGNVSYEVFGSDEHRAPDTETHGRLFPNHVPKEKQQFTNSDTNSAAGKQFDSKGHIRGDMEEGDKCTSQVQDLKPLGLNSTTTVKRKLDSRSRDSKRRRQSDPLQPSSAEERKASPVTSQTPQMSGGLQISDVWNSLNSSKGSAKVKMKKKHYCLYCKKAFVRMTQHHLSAHAREPEVAKALGYEEKSKERKQLLNLLQSKGNLLHKEKGTSIPEERPLDQASSSDSKSSCISKLENPTPGTVSSLLSAQLHNHTESASSPCRLVGEQLLADLQSQCDHNQGTRMDVHKKTTYSSPAHDQTAASTSEDKKTGAGQSSKNRHAVESRRRSSRIQTRPMRVKGNPSDEAGSMSQRSKRHVCQHCSNTFCSPYHLRRHEYTHTDIRPYWCSQCNIGFIQKYRYQNHRMTHHGERMSSKYKDPSRRCKKLSQSGEEPVENKVHQQQLEDGHAATSEPSCKAEECPALIETQEARECHDE